MSAATLVPDPAVVTLEEIVADDAGITLVLRTRRPTACCPVCDHPATRAHSWYTRRLADMPWQGLAVYLRLRARRWFCDNPRCARRIFTERLPTVARSHAQRTRRLATIVLVCGVAASGPAQRDPRDPATLTRQRAPNSSASAGSVLSGLFPHARPPR